MTDLVQRTVLENGVRVLSEHMDGVRSVSVSVLVDVGPKDERPDERGYAHLVEHMLFQGTGERDARAIAEMMEIGGGAMGAFTAREYTVYHATVLDEYLPFALEVLGDMLCNSVVPEEAVERQRSVILNEIAGHDDPLLMANDLLKASLWPDHPLGYPTVGSRETLQRATREKLLDFIERYYTADKVIITAAGNVDHDQFVAQVRDGFWQMKGCAAAGQTTLPPKPNLGSVVVTDRDLRQIYFALAWPAPAYTDPDRYAWHVFTSLFGGGPTSRLYRQLREEKGMAYHIGAQYQAYSNAGALVVEGATLPQTLVPVLAGVLVELLRIATDEGISEDDHYRAVHALVSQHLVSGDSAYVRMSRLALQEHYFGHAVTSDEVVAGLEAQQLAEVKQVAEQAFNTGMPTIALVGPVSEQISEAVCGMLADFGGPPTPAVIQEPADALGIQK